MAQAASLCVTWIGSQPFPNQDYNYVETQMKLGENNVRHKVTI